jgi:predicted GTPase
MIWNWRSWVLLVLLVGPVLAYIGFGSLWLHERGWLLYAWGLWIASGIVFAALAVRWTRSSRALLPPLDWDAPQTFSPFDRQAWAIVEEAAEQGDTVSLDALSEVDLYISTGRALARRLAGHYHPLSHDPIEHVPVVELLTALELAAEDLNHLSRQVPGGDLVTPAHLKTAVQAAGYLQKANDIYSFLLPLFSPVTGLVRLGTQQWMVKPAWRNMQQNLLRWFFRAYVNRLGTHLIELYSGRLVIGADQYRRLTRRSQAPREAQAIDEELTHLVVAVAGARGSGKSSLIAALEQARAGDPTLLKARLDAAGNDPSLIDRLRTARLVEVPGYTAGPEGETARDRSTRRDAVEEAVEADLLILVIDARRTSNAADVAFAQAWDRWYVEHPGLEAPPALVVLTGVDRLDPGVDWKPPYNWTKGQNPREAAVRARIEALRAALPPTLNEFAAAGLAAESPFGILEMVLPSLATLLHRAERAALIRHLHRLHSRSKARRLVSQVGQHGRWLWNSLRSGRKAPADVQQETPGH